MTPVGRGGGLLGYCGHAPVLAAANGYSAVIMTEDVSPLESHGCRQINNSPRRRLCRSPTGLAEAV
jgi:hypothetical protein